MSDRSENTTGDVIGEMKYLIDMKEILSSNSWELLIQKADPYDNFIRKIDMDTKSEIASIIENSINKKFSVYEEMLSQLNISNGARYAKYEKGGIFARRAVCSSCYEIIYNSMDEFDYAKSVDKLYKYCPHCGAKMSGVNM